jgi:hypothetical protein
MCKKNRIHAFNSLDPSSWKRTVQLHLCLYLLSQYVHTPFPSILTSPSLAYTTSPPTLPALIYLLTVPHLPELAVSCLVWGKGNVSETISPQNQL